MPQVVIHPACKAGAAVRFVSPEQLQSIKDRCKNMIEACENLIEETESQLPPLPRLVPQKNKNEPRWLEDIKTLSRLKATLVFRITEDDLVAFKKYQTWTIILHVDPQGSPLSVYGVRLNPLLMQVWHKGNLEHSG